MSSIVNKYLYPVHKNKLGLRDLFFPIFLLYTLGCFQTKLPFLLFRCSSMCKDYRVLQSDGMRATAVLCYSNKYVNPLFC